MSVTKGKQEAGLKVVTQDGNWFTIGHGVLLFKSNKVTHDFDLDGAGLAREEFVAWAKEHWKHPYEFFTFAKPPLAREPAESMCPKHGWSLPCPSCKYGDK